MGLISLKITKSKRTETYGYKLQIEFETVCFCTLAPASPRYAIELDGFGKFKKRADLDNLGTILSSFVTSTIKAS